MEPTRPWAPSAHGSFATTMKNETPLIGGRTTAGVVRVGDTVRRPAGPDHTLAHELLTHLERVGFPYSPRFLGIDEQGREILTYVEGWVPTDLGTFSDRQLQAAARIIAAFHDATTGSPLAAGSEVVCHGDLSPCNFVFRGDAPVAIIDFDACFRGSRRIDIGYAAWLWLDIGDPGLDPVDVGRRLSLFLHSCGVRSDMAVGAVLDAQSWLEQRCRASCSRDTEHWAAGCRAWVLTHRTLLEATTAGPVSGRGDR